VLCYEDKADRLLAEIALHSIDLVLSDVPATPAAGARIFNHLLGECGVGVFGIPRLADQYSRDFPRSLSAAPLLLPTPATALRRSLNQWFDSHALSPKIQAEIEDSALLKTFGAAGAGLFFAPTVLETQVREQYGVRLIGRIDEIRERFYAISSRRKQMHPGITAILDNASNALPDNPSTPTDLS
jgi:LysR family transcriptional activator of nhaA